MEHEFLGGGVTRQTIIAMEKGNYSPSVLLVLAVMLITKLVVLKYSRHRH